jgi:hypothetical protein
MNCEGCDMKLSSKLRCCHSLLGEGGVAEGYSLFHPRFELSTFRIQVKPYRLSQRVFFLFFMGVKLPVPLQGKDSGGMVF